MRTDDDRIALGGRGAPYHFGSKIRDDYDLAPKVFGELHGVLKSLFPALGDARITHTWGGCLGVPRDWFTSVGYDKQTGMAWAGGYVGDGSRPARRSAAGASSTSAGGVLDKVRAGDERGKDREPVGGRDRDRRAVEPGDSGAAGRPVAPVGAAKGHT